MDSLVQWFTANLSGVISKEAIIFIISMIPILELRGGLLAASPALLNVPILRAIPIPAPYEIWQGIWRDFSRYRAGDGDYVDSVLRRAGRAVWMMHR